MSPGSIPTPAPASTGIAEMKDELPTNATVTAINAAAAARPQRPTDERTRVRRDVIGSVWRGRSSAANERDQGEAEGGEPESGPGGGPRIASRRREGPPGRRLTDR